jgi:hypothetical protein
VYVATQFVRIAICALSNREAMCALRNRDYDSYVMITWRAGMQLPLPIIITPGC